MHKNMHTYKHTCTQAAANASIANIDSFDQYSGAIPAADPSNFGYPGDYREVS